MLSVLVLLFGGLLLGSCCLWWQVIGQWRRAEHPLPYRERPAGGPQPFAIVVTLFLWVFFQVLISEWFGLDPEEISLDHVQASYLSSVLMLLAVLILLVAPVIVSQGGGVAMEHFGIQRERLGEQVRYGATGFLASVAPVYLIVLATYPLRTEETQHRFLKLLSQQPDVATLAWMIAATMITAPLAEELVFRVVLQGGLEKLMRGGWAIVGTAVIFSVLHPMPDSLPLFPLALVLGYIYFRRHSYLAVVVVHMLFNGWNLVLALLVRWAGGLE